MIFCTSLQRKNQTSEAQGHGHLRIFRNKNKNLAVKA
jgi:hypothetical protein